jgi:hypothetical protein
MRNIVIIWTAYAPQDYFPLLSNTIIRLPFRPGLNLTSGPRLLLANWSLGNLCGLDGSRTSIPHLVSLSFIQYFHNVKPT